MMRYWEIQKVVPGASRWALVGFLTSFVVLAQQSSAYTGFVCQQSVGITNVSCRCTHACAWGVSYVHGSRETLNLREFANAAARSTCGSSNALVGCREVSSEEDTAVVASLTDVRASADLEATVHPGPPLTRAATSCVPRAAPLAQSRPLFLYLSSLLI
jgi:hypothetical protein